jgi:hypothetical protein
MVRIKQTAHPISNRVLPKPTNMASEDVAKVLSQQREDSVDAASSWSCDGSLDTSDSDSKSQSSDSGDTASESDSSKHTKVVTADAAVGITFNFDVSNVGKARVIATETHARYFPKGYYLAVGVETVPTPRMNEVMVFEDLFSAWLCMALHLVQAEIL